LIMNINEAVEISSRGYNNTLNNAQRVLVDAYIQCVLEQENDNGEKGFQWVMDTTELFEQLLNKTNNNAKTTKYHTVGRSAQ